LATNLFLTKHVMFRAHTVQISRATLHYWNIAGAYWSRLVK